MSKFLKDTGITFATRTSELFMGIVTSLIIARMLGPEGRGLLSLAILLPTFLVTFSEFGNGAASVYYLGQKEFSEKKIFGINTIFSTLISVIATLAGFFVAQYFSEQFFPGVDKSYLYLALLVVPFTVFVNSMSFILQGLNRIKKYNAVHFLKTATYTLLIVILIFFLRMGVKEAILAQAASVTISAAVILLLVYKEIGGISFKLNKEIFKSFFSYGGKVYLTNIISFLHLRVDAFMINIFINPVAVGFYSISAMLTEKLWLISKSASVVLFPKISGEKDEKKLNEFTPKVVRNLIFITAIISLVLFVVGRELIVFLYTDEFLPSVLPFYILLVGSVAISASRAITNDLLGRGRTNDHLLANIVSIALNIGLNIVLIPRMGITGAAIGTTISYTAALFLRLIMYNRISGNKFSDSLVVKKEDFAAYRIILNRLARRYAKK